MQRHDHACWISCPHDAFTLFFELTHALSQVFRGTFSHNVLIVLPFARRGFYLYLRRALRMV